MKRTLRVGTVWGTVAVAALPWLAGCSAVGRFLRTDRYRFLAPEKVIRPPEGSPINPIMGTIGPTDRARDVIPNAVWPDDSDLTYTDEDYIIGPTDILDISVLDLFIEGQETVLRRQVSAGGLVDLPLLTERILAEKCTKEQFKERVMAAYESASILRNPTVSVTIAARRQNTFSILGAVVRAGTYNVLRRDMRLLEGIALAGGISQTNIRYIYVIRPKPAVRIRKGEMAPIPDLRRRPEDDLPPLPPEAPGPETLPATRPVTQPATQPGVTDPNAALRELGKALPGTGPTTKPQTRPATQPTQPVPLLAATDAGGGTARTPPVEVDPNLSQAMPRAGGWVRRAGQWIRVPEPEATTRPVGPPATRPGAPDPTDPFGWKKVDKSDLARIIAINLRQLRAGDPRMNIVIRDNDIIHVPTLEVGEFYIMGEVIRPGVYSLTGRQITVKMAMAAAGNMTALAWPENSLLIRRIDGRQEQMIPLDLEAIFRGEDPDVFLKPNDVIAVGTEARSSFLAVMRNAFRMTYGFGFIYDRNFSNIRGVTPTSRRFTRW